MQRPDFISGLASAAALPVVRVPEGLPGSVVAGVRIPDSALAREATKLAASCEAPEIFAHSLRTFFFAELIARAKSVPHDVEAVYVAAILHDIGLCPEHMSPTRCFEVDGAEIARDLLRKHVAPVQRADLIWDAIALHDQTGIAPWKQPEVMLVNAGVRTDFGNSLDILARSDVVSVLAAAPRTGFAPVFLDVVAAYVKRKPFATETSWIADVGHRMVPGFHLGNFVDAVQSDPFAAYS